MKLKSLSLYLLINLLFVFPIMLRAGINHSDNGDGTYIYPVIFADFPDINILLVGDTYCLLSTTMFISPGVNILKSKDLVNCEACCNVVPRMDVHPAYNLDGGHRYGLGQWAGSLKYRDGTFYIMFNTLNDGGYMCTTKNPEGIWKVTKIKHGFLDPGFFFDEDGKIFVAHVYGKISVTELNNDFSLVAKDSLVFVGDIRGGIEGSHIYKQNGKYYFTYPLVQKKTEQLAYSIRDCPMDPFKFGGIIMDESPSCWANHQSIVQYKNQWYLFYHNNDYSPNFDKNRSICADSLFFDADGSIRKVIPTLRGVGQTLASGNIQLDRYADISKTGASIVFLDTTTCL